MSPNQHVYPFDPPFKLVDTVILASLSRNAQHGYGIEAHIVNITTGRIRPASGATYKALKRLAGEGLIEAVDGNPGDRRQYYRITRSGRAQLGRDLRLLRGIIRAFDPRFPG